MSKRKRTRYIGAYSEPPAPSISLPFTLANLRVLLAVGAQSDARYTHQQIKAWAGSFWWRYTDWRADPDASVPKEMKAAADLAQEIEMQWDMYLANTYTLPELQHLDFSQVRLPNEWFADWLARLNQLAPPTVFE
jgi:hypothetical protein